MIPIVAAEGWPEWEYRIVNPKTQFLTEWELNCLGKEGWLLVAVFSYPGLGGSTYFNQIFVRPKPEAEEGGGE